MTFDKLDFALFCIGSIAERLKLNQTEVYDKLQQSGINRRSNGKIFSLNNIPTYKSRSCRSTLQ